jgi:hypothetical protein
MKKFLLLLLPVFMFSCKGTEQYKTGIEELSTKWDETSANVSTFSTMLDGDLSNYSELLNMVTLNEEVAATVKPEMMEAFNASQANFTTSLSGLTTIKEDVNGFVAMMTEKTADLNSLKEGLAAGNLGADTATKLTDLNEMVAKGAEMLTTWNAGYTTSKSTVDTAAAALKEAFSTLTEGK